MFATQRRAARVGVARHAVPRLDLRPRQRQRFLHDQLGDVGEPIADLHQRQAADQIGDRDPKQGRALELAQHLDLSLRLLVLHVLATQRQILRELRARRRLLDQALVDQLIEQQRMRGDLVGEKLALLAQRDQPAQRRRVLVQQREIDGAAADHLEDFQDARQRRRRATWTAQ